MKKYKIIVKNTSIVVNDYEFNDCPKLENQFRIYDMISHSSYYLGLHYDADAKKLYLPRGIDIWYVEKLLNEDAYIEKNMYNPFDRFTDIRAKYLPRDDDQMKASRFMIGTGEYMETQTKSQLQLNLNTGKGKTYCAIATMAVLGIKSIVITDAVSVLMQWKANILDYTNMTPKSIYYIDGSGSIVRVLGKSQEEMEDTKVFLVTHSTLQHYASVNGWEAVSELFKCMRVGLKFFDEAHKNFANMLMIDFFTTVYKTYYITATPERSNNNENIIYQTSFKNVLCIDLFKEDTDPHTNYIAIRYSSHPEPQIISKCKNSYGLDRNKYTNYIVTNEIFLKMSAIIIDIALRLAMKSDEKILIYIGTNNAIALFKVWFIEMYPELEPNIGIFTSIIPAKEKKLVLTDKKIILSTTKSTGTAIDIKGLKVTIVLAEPFKSSVLARQTLGRTRADNTYYIELVDRGFYQCNRFFSDKKEIFNKYALTTELINISDIELEKRYNIILKARYAYLNAKMGMIPSGEVNTFCRVDMQQSEYASKLTTITPFIIEPFTLGD